MTQILIDYPGNIKASNMAHSTSQQAVELPRYRGHKSKPDDADQPVERYQSFDSTFVNEIPDTPNPTDFKDCPDLTTTQSLLDKPIIRKLIFRRHWFHTDMTIYTAHDTSTTNKSSPEIEASTTSSSGLTTNTSTPDPRKEAEETPIYHLATYEFNLSKPDIIMYAGSRPDPASILAVAHFRWSRNARMGFGADALDPDTNPNGVVWEELKNTSNYLLHSTYTFSVPTSLPSASTTSTFPSPPSSSTPSTRRNFRLQRTSSPSAGVTGWTGWLSYRNYLLIDMDAHETVGVFLADNWRSLTKKGELRLFKALGKEVEVGVVLALGCVSEKATRRERHGKGGDGG
jgi:hypothetical protein